MLFVSGCVNIVKVGIVGAESFPISPSVTTQVKSEFDVETRQFCDPELDCYHYYFLPNKARKQTLEMHHNASFTDTTYSTSLLVERQGLPTFTGSVVVIHGFRGSKDWSLMTAAYFQFLGFDTYVFDLLGHGELKTDKGFGVHDVRYIQRFIETNIDTTKPIIAVGNSMGGLVATSLTHEKIADGAILQAPMTQFDDSLEGYMKDKKPWYKAFLSDETIRSAANKALYDAGLNAQQTNTIDILKKSNSPFLIFASNVDSVSPYAAFSPLHSNNIEVVEIDKLEHAYMSMIGEFEHEKILAWLSANFDE
ncbi:alpha/beta hydrolase [Agaribacter marinus]|nr:alpha/beta fold hydrolase [Agaribacter marinus]